MGPLLDLMHVVSLGHFFSVLIVCGINAQLAARFEFSRHSHAYEIPGQVVCAFRHILLFLPLSLRSAISRWRV